MVSFIWPPGEPMLAGTGGSETFTAGHVLELLRRGIDAQIVTVGLEETNIPKDFPRLPFLRLKKIEEVSNLPGKIVFVNNDYDIPTKTKASVILHNAVTPELDTLLAYKNANLNNKTIIATSVYNSQQLAIHFKIPNRQIKVVMPFADPIYGKVKRPPISHKTRIVFAGRLHPHKGIYVLLEALHDLHLQKDKLEITIVAAGTHVEAGKTIKRMLRDYPYAKIIRARKSVKSMAKLLAANDILLMPSVYTEPFGMLSVEAQHAGCRVVASNIGGLPETNCGLLTAVKPRSPEALIAGIQRAIALGAATEKERERAKNYFTLTDSVDTLLKILYA